MGRSTRITRKFHNRAQQQGNKPALSTPALSTPALSTPASSTPASSTPASSTPITRTPTTRSLRTHSTRTIPTSSKDVRGMIGSQTYYVDKEGNVSYYTSNEDGYAIHNPSKSGHLMKSKWVNKSTSKINPGTTIKGVSIKTKTGYKMSQGITQNGVNKRDYYTLNNTYENVRTGPHVLKSNPSGFDMNKMTGNLWMSQFDPQPYTGKSGVKGPKKTNEVFDWSFD